MRLRTEQYLPTIIIALNFGAAVVYAVRGDVRKAIYWFASSVLISAVTY